MRHTLARSTAVLQAISLAAALTTVHAAHARRIDVRFLLDGALGVSFPIADSSYEDSFYPSPKVALRFGAEIWIRPHFALAPELSFDGGPLIGQHSSGVTTGRFRFQPGLRVLYGFGHGHALFGRFLVGGELLIFGPGGVLGAGKINLGPSFEPGFGMQFRIARHAVAGFTLGFPIGIHTLGTPVSSTNVDFDMCGFIGYRR